MLLRHIAGALGELVELTRAVPVVEVVVQRPPWCFFKHARFAPYGPGSKKRERNHSRDARTREKNNIRDEGKREEEKDAAFLAHAHVEDLAHALGEDGGSPLNQRELLGGDAACVVVRRDRVFF